MTTAIRTRRITAHTRRVIAAAAAVDDRSVIRYVDGHSIRSTVEARIEGALRALGMTEYLRASTDTTPRDGARS